MRRRAPEPRRKPHAALPLLVILGALLLSVPAGWNAFQFWRRLPQQRVSRLRVAEVQAAFDQINRDMPTEAREALALRRASNTLTGVFTGTVEPEQLQPTIGTAVNALAKSQVGRLQQAAARMWLLERAGEPVESWWPALRVFFEGMGRANLAHYQQALVQHWARAYESVRLGRGTACGLATDLVGQPHGPFLEFFVGRSRHLAEDCEATGDAAAAATCRSVLYRLLRQWVLEPGPAGLRLLAADLLADTLEADPVAAAAPETHAVMEELRAWRAAYRRAARERPIAVLDPQRKPAVAPAAHERLLRRVVLVSWVASAMTAVALATLLLAPAWRGSSGIHVRRLMLHALVCAVLVAGAGLLWVYLRPDAIREDLRGDFSSARYWWRHPFIAAGLTLALVFATALLQRAASGGESGLLARLGVTAAGGWLMLAVVLWGTVIAGESARRDYERLTRAAYEDVVSAVAGPQAERLLTGLRRWEP